jgi:hypothetical protein
MVDQYNPEDIAGNREDPFPESLLGDFAPSQLPEHDDEDEEGEEDADSV